MPPDKEFIEAVRLKIQALVSLEIRLLRTGQASPPGIVTDEISHSIVETQKEVAQLTRTMGRQEKAAFLRRMVRKVVDKEIDRAIRLRKNKCLRCIHARFYDRLGAAFETLPITAPFVQAIGCDQLRPSLRKTCKRFIEIVTAHSLEDYLNEMNFLYEFRERFEQIEEVWKEDLESRTK
jgi:hypothetical protein